MNEEELIISSQASWLCRYTQSLKATTPPVLASSVAWFGFSPTVKEIPVGWAEWVCVLQDAEYGNYSVVIGPFNQYQVECIEQFSGNEAGLQKAKALCAQVARFLNIEDRGCASDIDPGAVGGKNWLMLAFLMMPFLLLLVFALLWAYK